jgi:hypothetical protein
MKALYLDETAWHKNMLRRPRLNRENHTEVKVMSFLHFPFGGGLCLCRATVRLLCGQSTSVLRQHITTTIHCQ